MPARTKKPSRKVTQSEKFDDVFRKDLRKIIDEQKRILDTHYMNECTKIDIAFKILTSSLGKIKLEKTIHQLKNELVLPETDVSAAISNITLSSYSDTRSISDDGGYVTECSETSANRKRTSRTGTASKIQHASRRRSRSTDTTSRRMNPPSTVQRTIRRRSKSTYQTPAYNKTALVQFTPITPKVVPNVPLTIMRQPRQGEMVVSMAGSPLMVHAQQPNQLANCNIALTDGTVLSLLPEKFRKSQTHIPASLLDDDVIKQLNTLKDNLEAVVKAGRNKD